MKRKHGKHANRPGPVKAGPGPGERAERRRDGANLSDHDLRQMDPAWQQQQPDATVRALLTRALDDLRLARDRLNQTPGNSSRPSGSMPPRQRPGASAGAAEDNGGLDDKLDDDAPEREARHPDRRAGDAARPTEDPDTDTETDTAQSPGPAQPAAPDSGRPAGDAQCAAAAAAQGNTPVLALAKPAARPGRRVGAPGFGREQKLEPTCTQEHRPSCCAACLAALPSDAPQQAWTGWDTLELVALSPSAQGTSATPTEPVVLGARIEVTRHLLLQQTCGCGHTTRARAARADEDLLWPGVDISEQRLLGARLAATVVYLCLRMRSAAAQGQRADAGAV